MQRPNRLAYVEWFTLFAQPSVHHGLYKVRRSLRTRDHIQVRLESVVPIEQLERSCHLLPEFGPVACRKWTSQNVLDECPVFYVNAFSDCHMYKLVY